MKKIEPTLGNLDTALENDPVVDPPIGDLDAVCLREHRTQEKEGITPQDEKTFLSFIIACVVTGVVIGLMVVYLS